MNRKSFLASLVASFATFRLGGGKVEPVESDLEKLMRLHPLREVEIPYLPSPKGVRVGLPSVGWKVINRTGL